MSKKNKNRFARPVAIIQAAALQSGRELTYQQALSIHFRSRQLHRESNFHSDRISPEELERQINRCYEQRSMRQDIITG